jgi:hypothetical protein
MNGFIYIIFGTKINVNFVSITIQILFTHINHILNPSTNKAQIPKSLKLQIGEDADYDKVIARQKAQGLGDSWSDYMKIH